MNYNNPPLADDFLELVITSGSHHNWWANGVRFALLTLLRYAKPSIYFFI